MKTIFDFFLIEQRKRELQLAFTTPELSEERVFEMSSCILGCSSSCEGTCYSSCDGSCEGRCSGCGKS